MTDKAIIKRRNPRLTLPKVDRGFLFDSFKNRYRLTTPAIALSVDNHSYWLEDSFQSDVGQSREKPAYR